MYFHVIYKENDKGIMVMIRYMGPYRKWRQKWKQGFDSKKDAQPWIHETMRKIDCELRSQWADSRKQNK